MKIKCLCEDKKYHANTILKNAYFGSKSEFRMAHPDLHPMFNTYLLAQNDNGELEKIWYGDIEMSIHSGMLKILAKTINSDLYLYKESTVNNQVINGRRFPYENWSVYVSKLGEIDKRLG